MCVASNPILLYWLLIFILNHQIYFLATNKFDMRVFGYVFPHQVTEYLFAVMLSDTEQTGCKY